MPDEPKAGGDPGRRLGARPTPCPWPIPSSRDC